MQGHVHPSTVILALRILLALLHNQAAISKFREGQYGGGWLDQTEPVLHNRIGVVLGKEFLFMFDNNYDVSFKDFAFYFFFHVYFIFKHGNQVLRNQQPNDKEENRQ